MKLFTKSILLGLCVLACQAFAGDDAPSGPSEPGGGDPLANEFLDAGLVVKSMLQTHAIPSLDVDSTQFGTWISKIDKSLDGIAPLLTFPAGKTLDCFGEPKVGCVDIAGKIRVARDSFVVYPSSEKYELVALEIFKLMNVQDRYQKARLIRDHARVQTATIESHVRFMVQNQISTYLLRYNGGVSSSSNCTRIGGSIERLGILAELIQMLVMEGKMDQSILAKAHVLDDSARELYPICGINGNVDPSQKEATYRAIIAKMDVAIVQLKSALTGTSAPTESPAPSPTRTAVYTKTPKPGLSEGQMFRLAADLNLIADSSGNTWNYFSNGQRVETSMRHERQGYCAINNTFGKMPARLIHDGVRTVPASASPLRLYEISWYVDTIFLSGKIDEIGEVGIVIYCGKFHNGSAGGDDLTSLDAIKTHLQGILELQ